jgi:ubiquitin carboxyl-terminal hydrolase 5/13
LNHPLVVAATPTTAPTDLFCQTAKLACALTSGAYATRPASDPNAYRVAPRMMKHCIGKDHVDFRTAQQQDAAQFLQYFLEKLDRAEIAAGMGKVSSNLFSTYTTTRLQCAADSKVKYTESSGPETVWSLRIPMERATVVAADEIASPDQKRFKAEDDEAVAAVAPKDETKPVPTIALEICIKEWGAATVVEDLRWPHLGNASYPASQTIRFANFPRYIILQLQRYELGPDWTPIKLEVNVDIPQELDLNEYKSSGPKDDEDIIPEEEAASTKAGADSSKPPLNEAAIAQLMDMGFSRNSCIRALQAVGGNDVEQAMGWVFEHNVRCLFCCWCCCLVAARFRMSDSLVLYRTDGP